jgi:hypothetical protein
VRPNILVAKVRNPIISDTGLTPVTKTAKHNRCTVIKGKLRTTSIVSDLSRGGVLALPLVDNSVSSFNYANNDEH